MILRVIINIGMGFPTPLLLAAMILAGPLLARGEEEIVVEEAPGTVPSPAAAGAPPTTIAQSADAAGETVAPASPSAATELRLPQIDVLGRALEATLMTRTPGSAAIVERAALEQARVFTTNEALRKVTGVTVRDEEGLGLRPNIGLRGLDPNRSRKVLLLEDGIPLGYAPYGDNASYYHPPIERMDHVEVLKGSSQLQYGPSTIGGVVNYVTPRPFAQPGGFVKLGGGNRGYYGAQLAYGGLWGENGLRLDLSRKHALGARANTESTLTDLNFKAVLGLGSNSALTLRANRYVEDSQVTYSGLTLDEWKRDPFQNPFRNDRFEGSRDGLSATHEWTPTDALTITTNLYGSQFARDWWRQASTSAQRPNDAADAACGGMANLDTTCGNEGRLRRYQLAGVEPRAAWRHSLLGSEALLEAGLRLHGETQARRQESGATPTARTGMLVENNLRGVLALAGFVQERFSIGPVTLQPGLRVEHVRMSRTNLLANEGGGVSGATNVTQLIPGVGVNVNLDPRWTLFAGLHRGFAPPRPEDVVSNSDGKVLELEPELSWNYELGVRAQPHRVARFELTGFLLDFSNQLVPASVSGGAGAAITNGGATRNAGLELGWHLDTEGTWASSHRFFSDLSFTWLPVARFEGERRSAFDANVSVGGNRVPYAATDTLTVSAGWAHASGVDLRAEFAHVGAMFSDDLNTPTFEGSADGQRGLIPAMHVVNLAANWTVPALRTTFFATVKNALDATWVADRSRGLLPGAPRLIQAGVRKEF